MASFARTAALLLLLAPTASAFTPPKTPTSANVATGSSSSSSSPPKAISIPVDEPTTTSSASAPWDRISKDEDTTARGGRDDWVQNLDYEAFAKDVTALGKELQESSGPDDVEHLNKVS